MTPVTHAARGAPIRQRTPTMSMKQLLFTETGFVRIAIAPAGAGINHQLGTREVATSCQGTRGHSNRRNPSGLPGRTAQSRETR